MPAPKDPKKYEEWKRKLSERTKQTMSDPEMIARLSKTRKGRPSPNKGKLMSEAQKEKLSKRAKARWEKPEYKEKVSSTLFKKGQVPHNKGKPLSEKQKEKLVASRKGKPSWNKGIPISEEQKTKLSAAKRGIKQKPEVVEKRAKSIKLNYDNGLRVLSEEGRQKMSAAHKGKIVSAETRKKQSLSKKGKPGNRTGIPQPPETLKRMAQISRKQWDDMTDEQKVAKLEILRESTKDITKSALEEVVALELDAQGIVYERQKKIGWYRVDFYIPEQNLIIEAQGCFWHACKQCGEELHKKKREADAKRHEYLVRKGYSLKTIWEHERRSELRKYRQKN